jgi:hypothetical protein
VISYGNIEKRCRVFFYQGDVVCILVYDYPKTIPSFTVALTIHFSVFTGLLKKFASPQHVSLGEFSRAYRPKKSSQPSQEYNITYFLPTKLYGSVLENTTLN